MFLKLIIVPANLRGDSLPHTLMSSVSANFLQQKIRER